MPKTLFDPLKLGTLLLKNRIIMAPMTRGRADDAGVLPEMTADYYAQRASAGLIVTEAVNITPCSKANDNIPGIFTPAQLDSWKKVTTAVHERDGKIFMQLFHTGRLSLPQLLSEPATPVAPSAIAANWQNYTRNGAESTVMPRALLKEEIPQMVQAFVSAAQNAINAGFDGVELHGGYGYLIHQFLGTNSNIRTDEYGGSPENRVRFLLETLDAVTAAIGAEKTGIRLTPGISLHDMAEDDAETLYPYILQELSSRGLAYLNIALTMEPPVHINWHERLRPLYNGVYIANGNFSQASGEQLLAAGNADAISYGRPFIANPDLAERFREDAVLSTSDQATHYGCTAKGYTDYPYREKVIA